MPGCGEEPSVCRKALAGDDRRGTGQGDRRIRRPGEAQVEIGVPLQDRDVLSSRVPPGDDRHSIRQLRVLEGEGTSAVAAHCAGGGQQAAGGLQRLRIVRGADREHQRFRILWHGEERHPLVGIEAVLVRRARVQHVEAGALAHRAREVIEEAPHGKLGGHLAVHGHP